MSISTGAPAIQAGKKAKLPLWPVIFGLWKASTLLAGKTVHFYTGKFVFGEVSRIRLHHSYITYRGITVSSPEGFTFEGGTVSTEPALKSIGSALMRLPGNKMPAIVKISFPQDEGKVRDFLRLLIRTDVSFSEAAKETGITEEPIRIEGLEKILDAVAFAD